MKTSFFLYFEGRDTVRKADCVEKQDAVLCLPESRVNMLKG